MEYSLNKGGIRNANTNIGQVRISKQKQKKMKTSERGEEYKTCEYMCMCNWPSSIKNAIFNYSNNWKLKNQE